MLPEQNPPPPTYKIKEFMLYQKCKTKTHKSLNDGLLGGGSLPEPASSAHLEETRGGGLWDGWNEEVERWIYRAATLTCGWMECPKKGKVFALQLMAGFPRSLSDPFSTGVAGAREGGALWSHAGGWEGDL